MNRRRGFSLTFVIIALILVGVGMFVLAGNSNVMLFYADKAYVQAVERNLTASGLAWVRAKVSSDPNLPAGEPVELDVSAFGCPNARLVVQILDVQDGKARARIDTSCRKGRNALHVSRDCAVAIP